jgi:hypothetical protein
MNAPKKTFAELEAGLKIDPHALEHVCRDHPELFYHVAKRLALLISQRDEAKQKLKELCAEVDAEIRQEAHETNQKLREGDIESQVLLTPAVQDANKQLADYEKELGEMLALKEAYQSRSFALRDLVQLHLANYYGSDMERPTGNMRGVHVEQNKQKAAELYRRR